MSTTILPQPSVRSNPYGKKRDGDLYFAGKTTVTRSGDTYLKSVPLSYEDALLLCRALNEHERVTLAEVGRNHHAKKNDPLKYYVRFVTDLRENDINIRRALYQFGEMLDAALEGQEGVAWVVIHAFPEAMGGECHVYRATRTTCNCPHATYRRADCKHQQYLRMKYPLKADVGEVRSRFEGMDFNEALAVMAEDYP